MNVCSHGKRTWGEMGIDVMSLDFSPTWAIGTFLKSVGLRSIDLSTCCHTGFILLDRHFPE